MAFPRPDLLEQEVRELTELLRHGGDPWGDLRALLDERGLDPQNTILAGLIEGEDESSYGVFVTRDDVPLVFETARDRSVLRWERVADVAALADDFEAVPTALALRQELIA